VSVGPKFFLRVYFFVYAVLSVPASLILPSLYCTNDAVEWLSHLLRIRKVPGSNLSPETTYPEYICVVLLKPP
jgi:hypothetical protein